MDAMNVRCIIAALFYVNIIGSVLTNVIFVSPCGKDTNNGKGAKTPLQSVYKALSAAESFTSKNKDATIYLVCSPCKSPCYFELDKTAVITNKGSGTLAIKRHGQHDVHLVGGKLINPTKFTKVTDKGALQRIPSASKSKVLQVTLPSVGITDLGTMSGYGYYTKRVAPLEIFENSEALTLARYPNEHYINILKPSKDKKTFQFDSDAPKTWKNEKDVWAHGFWYWSWADKAYKVTSLNPGDKKATLSEPAMYGLREGHYNSEDPKSSNYHKQGGYFRFVNVLSELDQPGEYYVDRKTKNLYVWPLKNAGYNKNDIIQASIIDNCIQITDGSSNIVLEAFTVEACRHFGILGNDINKISFTKMRIQNLGSFGMVLSKSTDVKITQSEIRNTDGGIDIRGGDRNTLKASGNEIADCLISNFGRATYTGSDGISLYGVGTKVHHNKIWDGSYTGIRWEGNDFHFEYNHISRMCSKTSDCGAFMSGRDWTRRGNLIKNNHIQNTVRRVPGADVRAVMLDDQYSSVDIRNNVFFNNDVDVRIAGGRDNGVFHNVFYSAHQYSISVDARGLQHKHTDFLTKKLNAVPYKSQLWRSRYPKLAAIENNDPDEPEGNRIEQNIVYYPVNRTFVSGPTHGPEWYKVANNIQTEDEQNFYAPAYGDMKPICKLASFASRVKFGKPVLPNQVGPRYPVGPTVSDDITDSITEQCLEKTFQGYKTGRAPAPKSCKVAGPAKMLRSAEGLSKVVDDDFLRRLQEIWF